MILHTCVFVFVFGSACVRVCVLSTACVPGTHEDTDSDSDSDLLLTYNIRLMVVQERQRERHTRTDNRQVSWHLYRERAPTRGSQFGEALNSTLSQFGVALKEQSEETEAIWQHLQATDPDNSDIHVEEYIIQEHNDDQVSSDGTMAWERNIRHFQHITAQLTTCPADLPLLNRGVCSV